MDITNITFDRDKNLLTFDGTEEGNRFSIECTEKEIALFAIEYWWDEHSIWSKEELLQDYIPDEYGYIYFAKENESYSKQIPNTEAPIVFVTARTDHNVNHKSIYNNNNILDAVYDCLNYIRNLDTPALDIEASDLIPQYATVLLLAIGGKDRQWVFDMTSVPFSCLAPIEDENFQYLGHNIKYDRNVLACNGFHIRKVWDTMIAEQTLRRGSLAGNTLEEVMFRRLQIPHEVGKDIRKTFIGRHKDMIFYTDHIRYVAADIKKLPEIKEIQIEKAKETRLLDWLEKWEFPLIPVIGECECEGLRLDKEKWRGVIAANRKSLREYELEADKEVQELLAKQGKKELLSGKYTRKRRNIDIVQTSLFGDDKITQNKCQGNISYGSEKQVKDLLRKLGVEPPVVKIKGEFKESVGKDALEEWLIANPMHRLGRFIKILVQIADLRTKISAFGENYINAINVKTGKIHTIYSTAATDTGRFSSGNMQFKLINSQNIPKLKIYRQCFGTDEGYDMVTCDLSGAELIILASMAGDKKLIELAKNGDVHGYLATASYRNLITHYLNEAAARDKSPAVALRDLMDGLKPEEKITDDDIAEIIANPRGIVISKERFKWIRDKFKNCVYGIAYGASNIRIAKVLTVDKVAAQLVLDTIAMELPVTMEYLDSVAAFGLYYGYIEFNQRSHCRRWLEKVIDLAKAGIPLSFGDKNAIERLCKNAPVQGTQANMVKEAIVDIDNYIKENKLDCKLLITVHDELVYKMPKYLNEDILVYDGQSYNFPGLVKKMMCDASDRYLKDVNMGAEYNVLETWTK